MEIEADTKSEEKSGEHVTVNSDQPLLETLDSLDQPLLGSVTTFSNAEGSEAKVQQIRSSARVFKKMKLDLSAPLVLEKNEKKEESKPDIKKCCRPLWGSNDKNIFFEALCEYGKDFENIQLYINNKLKKKGVPDHLVKTKDQVRHFYYRSWHKIFKYLKFADGVKKVVQELYGLINYGELRKKLGSVSEKSLQKLNELVYLGSTVLRLKGKTVRVKTPMCKALRHLNQLDEKYDEVKLPYKVTVEFHPKNMSSFLKVQSMAQNPRLIATMPLQKRVSNVIDYLSNKWKTYEARTYEKALISSSIITNSCLPPEKVCEATMIKLNPPLRLTPPESSRIELPSINISEYLTRQNICLNYYENRIGIFNSNSASLANCNNFKVATKNSSRKNNRPRTGSMSDRSEKWQQKNIVKDVEEIELCDRNCDNVDGELVLEEKCNETKLENQETEIHKLKLEKADDIENDDKQKQARIETIRRGWTVQNCDSLTVGELYLMFGSDSRLVLEYSWDMLQNEDQSKISESIDKTEVSEINKNFSEDESDLKSHKDSELSHALSRLLSIAKLHYRKNIIKCACGHVCGTKNEAQLKRAVHSKIMKMFTTMDKCSDDGELKIASEDNLFDSERFLKPSVYIKPKIHPISPSPFYQTNNIGYVTSQINSIQGLKPRYCNRKGRKPKSKQVVVERKLPLLPNNVESGHQIVRMNIISQDDTQGASSSSNELLLDKVILPEAQPPVTFQNSSDPVFLPDSTDQVYKNSNDSLILMNENTVLSTAPPSPATILKQDNQEWIESEVADYSLSSLLGHLESPIKGEGSASNMSSYDSRLSQDVDAQLRSLLTENSIDFSANFADLAEQVTNEIKNDTQ